MKHISRLILISSLFIFSAGCNNTPPANTPGVSPTAQVPVRGATSSRPVVLQQVREIVAKQLGIDVQSVDSDSPLAKQKAAADDLDVVEIIMATERHFNIEIRDEEVSTSGGELRESLSVEKLTDIVMRKQRENE